MCVSFVVVCVVELLVIFCVCINYSNKENELVSVKSVVDKQSKAATILEEKYQLVIVINSY